MKSRQTISTPLQAADKSLNTQFLISELRTPWVSLADLHATLTAIGLRDNQLVQKALDQTRLSHGTQIREGGSPYLEEHIYPVTKSVIDHLSAAGQSVTAEIVAAALTHDVSEDDPTMPLEKLRDYFGPYIGSSSNGATNPVEIVAPLTKPDLSTFPGDSDAERQEARNKAYFAGLERGRAEVAIIKVADRENNILCSHKLTNPREIVSYCDETVAKILPLAQRVLPGMARSIDARIGILRQVAAFRIETEGPPPPLASVNSLRLPDPVGTLPLSSSVTPKSEVSKTFSNIAADAPLGRVREKLVSDFTCYVGGDVAPAVLRLVNSYRREGFSRLSDDEMVRRLDAVIERAGRILEMIPEVEGIIHFGSALRGKETPNDFDLMWVTGFETLGATPWLPKSQPLLFVVEVIAHIPGVAWALNRIFLNDYAKVERALNSREGSPLRAPIDGIQVSQTVHISFENQGSLFEGDEFPRQGTNFALQVGPLLVITRGAPNHPPELLFTEGNPNFKGATKQSLIGVKGVVEV